eukprot:69775-Chlamydomonas_euryale.AAC.2
MTQRLREPRHLRDAAVRLLIMQRTCTPPRVPSSLLPPPLLLIPFASSLLLPPFPLLSPASPPFPSSLLLPPFPPIQYKTPATAGMKQSSSALRRALAHHKHSTLIQLQLPVWKIDAPSEPFRYTATAGVKCRGGPGIAAGHR